MTSARNAEILDLVATGLPFSEVAEKMGCSRGVVAGVVHRAKGSARRGRGNALGVRRTKRKGAKTAPSTRRSCDPIGCRWIDGDPKVKGGWSYCGAEQLPDSQWCAVHHQCVYRPREGAA